MRARGVRGVIVKWGGDNQKGGDKENGDENEKGGR